MDGVEGDGAEILGELGGAVAEVCDELGDGEGGGLDAVEALSEGDEDEDEGEVEGVGDVIEEVGDGLVELKDVGDEEAEGGGGAHDGEGAEDGAEGDAPGEFLGGGALAELAAEGQDDPALEAGWGRD